MDISDGHTLLQALGRQSQPSASSGTGAGMSTGPEAGRAAPIHSRLLAMMMAARYYGLELDPNEFRPGQGESRPTAAALSAWAQGAGMWARALRLKWRHLFSVTGAGPVVL